MLGGPPGCSLSSLAPDLSRCKAALGCGSFPLSSCHSQLPASRADVPGLFLLVLDLKRVLKKNSASVFAVVSNWELKPKVRSETRMRSALGSAGSGELACAAPRWDESFALCPRPQNPPRSIGARWQGLGHAWKWGFRCGNVDSTSPWPWWLLVGATARCDDAGGCRDALRLSRRGDFGTPGGFWHAVGFLAVWG